MVISVHSVVGLDFAAGLTPGWHSTQFAPYFFFGAVISGVALVIMLTILIRHGYQLQEIITGYHLNAMAKVMLTGSVMLGYAYLWEGWGPIYSNNIADRTALIATVLGPYAPSYWTRVALNIVIPQLLWLPRVRRSEVLLFLISLGIIVGMWLERYDIVIPNLARNWMPSYWGVYYPTLWDWAILAGSIGLFLTTFLLLVRVLPIVSLAEVREIIAKGGSQ
jgi:molybdopterin-containing oxidoreductase family membrane subunit